MVKGPVVEYTGRGDPGVRFDKLNELREEVGKVFEPAVPELVEGSKGRGWGQRGRGMVPLEFVSTLQSFDKLRTVQAQQTWGWRSS